MLGQIGEYLDSCDPACYALLEMLGAVEYVEYLSIARFGGRVSHSRGGSGREWRKDGIFPLKHEVTCVRRESFYKMTHESCKSPWP